MWYVRGFFFGSVSYEYVLLWSDINISINNILFI